MFLTTLSWLELTLSFFFLIGSASIQRVEHQRYDGQSVLQASSYEDDSSSNSCSFWLESLGGAHDGFAPFATPNYQTFRNVRDFGAVGDGVHDDTAAINRAISDGGRCAPLLCLSSTTTPALVYFPPGRYKISSPIVPFYYTLLVGNPNCMPVLQAAPDFSGFALIDADPYFPCPCGSGVQSWFNTNVFWRQIRNLVLDMTPFPAASPITGIHWPTGQATSLQNIIFKMSAATTTTHKGVLVENGSGGFMTDLVFHGGLTGADFGNQQFTTRNLTFHNVQTAIHQQWDWGWTYVGVGVYDCGIGVDMSSLDSTGTVQQVGSINFIDSEIVNTPTGFLTSHSASSQPSSGGSLYLENVQLNNVKDAVKNLAGAVALAGTAGTTTIDAWVQGHIYTPTGPVDVAESIAPTARSPSLTKAGVYYQRSKPQYENYGESSFLSVRDQGATGDGVTDDTSALQRAFNQAASTGLVLLVDAGYYRVTKTITIPTGSKVVGEAYPVILATGAFFADQNNPQPVVAVGRKGDGGMVEWSDMIISTQGAAAGAILIQWNLASSVSTPSGMWDVHTRIAGFTESSLSLATCAKTPGSTAVNALCMAAFMSMHVTPGAAGLYMENVWLWQADHDVDSLVQDSDGQLTAYAGRGLYIDSSPGPIWLFGTASEHHQFYQYQVWNSSNVLMGYVQTETAYYQPNPPSFGPYIAQSSWNDPSFPPGCVSSDPSMKNVCSGYGMRIVKSANVAIYGAGFYSFYENYAQTCLATQDCQASVFSVEAGNVGLSVYGLNTIGSQSMITRDGLSMVKANDNLGGGVVDRVALFRG